MHAMPDRPRAALGLLVGLIAVLLSACGTTGTPTTTVHADVSASTPNALPTKARFAAQAQAICVTLSAQEKPLEARQGSLKGLPITTAEKAFVSLARQVVVLSRAADSKLERLPRPPSDARAIEQLLRSFSEEATDATGIADAAANQESTAGEAAEGALKKSIAANSSLAAAYGMKDCIGSE
jgi:hypothetical protein